MYSNFKEQAIEYVKEAVHEDNAGNYAKAFPLYMNALEYFRTHLKYEQNPKIRVAIQQKFTEYLNRAEEIRAVLDGHDHRGHRGFGSSSSGGGGGTSSAVVAMAIPVETNNKPKDIAEDIHISIA